MTYPPQQPGPYGQDPYGQQPPQTPPYGGQSSYQGLGSYGPPPPPPPKKRNTGMIVAIVLIVLLVLGGGGVAVWVLTKNNDSDNNAADDKKTDQNSPASTGDEPTSESEEPTGDQGTDGATNTPDDVRDAYMEAYETKSFTSVVNSACAAYKSKYGTDTSDLEKTLAPYDITASPSGEPDVNGNTATANIDLQLTQAGTTEKPSIFIKIVEEDGEWRFCGEGESS